MLEQALKYADNGWYVFPVHGIVKGQCTCRMRCSSPGKHPIPKDGLNAATTDENQIRKWFEEYPNANIAIATGEQSGLWVVDIDNKHSVEIGNQLVGHGEHSWRELEELNGRVNDTMSVETGSGGVHYYFQWTSGCGGNRANLMPGIDVRGEGGYVVAPPSVHASGHVYSWWDEGLLPIVPPNWLVVFAKTNAPSVEVDDDDVVVEGGRNVFLHNLGAKYRREEGYREFQIYGLLMAHNHKQCRPPLSREEVARIAKSCARYDYVPPVDLSE